MKIKKLMIVALLCGSAARVWAHDPGLSYLTVCQSDAQITVTWTLHEADRIDASGLSLSTGDTVHPVTRFASKASGDDTELRWSFDPGAKSFEVDVAALLSLPFGHRVLASDCGSQQRAVLSRRSTRWALPTPFAKTAASMAR